MGTNPNTALSVSQGDAELAAIAATKNDLSQMSESQRAQLYGAVCRSVGLNPLTSPFEYIKLNGKLTLYAKKGATDQIRETRGISITSIEKDVMDGVLMVTVTASDKSGRTDTDVGAVVVAGLKGDALANAYMKAITKAKRRVTLSLAGLGFLDETEVETVPNATTVTVDHATGEIEAPDPHKAMKRLHAVANKHGFKHEDLHLWARDRGKDSVKEFSERALNEMADSIEANIDGAKHYFEGLRNAAELEEAGRQLSAQIDGEVIDTDGVIQESSVEQSALAEPASK